MNTRFLPWLGGGSSTELKPVGSTGPMLRTQIYPTDEGLLDTLDLRLTEGHGFTHEHVASDTRRINALFAGERPRGPDGHPAD